ncbi:hypothetical protein K3495_g9098 [Podosphaera aphanis]|nr:hypothetical protein K3495_g9098 [Podosphaera aphanis]
MNFFGVPKELISDNARCFSGNEAKNFQIKYGFYVTHTTPARQRRNGKSQFTTVAFHLRDTAYISFLFGTQPPDEELAYHQYIREATDHEQKAWDEEHARLHAAPIACSYVNSMKAVRAKTRAYLQEKKALLRTYVTGD